MKHAGTVTDLRTRAGTTRARIRRGPAFQSRGTVYLIVLSTVTLVVAMSLTGLTLAQAQRRAVAIDVDTDHARALALSGIEVGLEMINTSGKWRSSSGRDGSLASFSLGPGRVAIAAADPLDDDLADSPTDPVTLTATAKVGHALQTVAVGLEPQYTPAPVLSRGLAAGGTMTLSDAAVIATTPIAANVSITAASSSIIADAESLLIIGGTFHAGQRVLSLADPMPAGVASAYTAEGTSIPLSQVKSNKLRDILLSPASNPLSGTLNPRGVYIIDCAGQSLRIRNVRIVGTLVLLNAGTNTRLDEGVLMEPAQPGYPALVIDGPLQVRVDGRALTEEGEVNFNPPGSPIGGVTNSATSDTFASGIVGVVYASGEISFDGTLALQGSMIAGTNMSVRGSLTIGRFLDTLAFPPPGFRDRMVMAVVPGSWSRVVDLDTPKEPEGEPIKPVR